MASVKIILRKKKNKYGTFPDVHPITLRITRNRKTSFIYLGHYIKENDWDADQQRVKKSHSNSTRLNNFLITKLAEATNKSLELETLNNHVSSHAVKHRIKPIGGTSFFGQGDLYIERLKEAGKYNQYTAEKPRVKRFRTFIGHDIAFQDITPVMLERFKNYLIAEIEVSERTAVNHLVVIRSVFSQAIKDNIIDQRYYPFGKGKVKIKFPDSTKIGLTLDEIKQLENVQLSNEQHHHARNLFLISFYFAGMRVSDVLRLRWCDLQNDRLHYTMGKNNKGGSFMIPEKATQIFAQYKKARKNINDLIFPELKECELEDKFITQRTIAFKTSAIDKCLRLHVGPQAKIHKLITMHLARHTFGNIAGDAIPIQMLQKLYRHSSITTTIGYQANFLNRDTDEALAAVIG